jgi:hypothetical protein
MGRVQEELSMRLLAIVFLAALTLVSGCGGSSSCTAVSFSGACFGYVTQGTLTATETSLSGTGSLVAETPLSGASSNNSFRLTFTLQDGGSVSLFANSTAALADGIEIEMKRQGSALEVHVKKGGTDFDASSSFTSVSATAAVTLQIDVHNSESPVHLLVWGESTTDFSESNTLLNEEASTPPSGTGTYWGLELENATVTSAAAGTQKFTE